MCVCVCVCVCGGGGGQYRGGLFREVNSDSIVGTVLSGLNGSIV